MGVESFPAYLGLFSAVVGVVGLIAGAAFYLRYTGTKANLDGKDETIETLKANRDEWKNKAQELEKEAISLRAETKSLREIATQTPEILTLTATVNKSIEQQGVVATNLAKLTSEIRSLINSERKAISK